MRAALFALAVLCAVSSTARAVVVLNFDSLPSTTNYSNGQAVPASDQLSSQYLSSQGILFASGSPYVAVGNYGANVATSGTNAIAGSSTFGRFDYSAAVVFSFWDPSDPSTFATTNFFSVRGDRDATGGGVSVTVTAYDVNGDLIGSDTEIDSGGETWTLSLPGIHSVRFPGTSANPSFGGIALDDVTFNPVSIPEPTMATFLVIAAAAGTLGRGSRNTKARVTEGTVS